MNFDIARGRQSPVQEDRPTRRRSPWPYGIALALATSVAINLWMVSIAVSHPSAPSTNDHWRESVEFDQELAKRRESTELGWVVEVLPCANTKPTCEVQIRVHDAHAQAIAGLQGFVQLQRGDTTHLDRAATLVASPTAGTYLAQVELGARGHYLAQVRLENETQHWQGQRPVKFSAGMP